MPSPSANLDETCDQLINSCPRSQPGRYVDGLGYFKGVVKISSNDDASERKEVANRVIVTTLTYTTNQNVQFRPLTFQSSQLEAMKPHRTIAHLTIASEELTTFQTGKQALDVQVAFSACSQSHLFLLFRLAFPNLRAFHYICLQ